MFDLNEIVFIIVLKDCFYLFLIYSYFFIESSVKSIPYFFILKALHFCFFKFVKRKPRKLKSVFIHINTFDNFFLISFENLFDNWDVFPRVATTFCLRM